MNTEHKWYKGKIKEKLCLRSKTGLNLAFSKPQVIIHTVATYKINSVINGQEFF